MDRLIGQLAEQIANLTLAQANWLAVLLRRRLDADGHLPCGVPSPKPKEPSYESSCHSPIPSNVDHE